MDTATTPSRRRIAKPLGVSILTTFDGVFIGLVPLILLIILDNDTNLKISQLDYYLSASLCIIVVAAALGAFMGENLGRVILLWAVTATSVLMILNTIDSLSSGEGTGSQGLGLIGNITRGLFWIGINWWYFNRKDVVDYYKQNRDDQRESRAAHTELKEP